MKITYIILLVLLLIGILLAFYIPQNIGTVINKVDSDQIENDLGVEDKYIMAKQVANENGFVSDDIVADMSETLIKVEGSSKLESKETIRLKSCKLNKTMHLDPNTFEVLKFEDEVWCGGEI